MSNNIIDFNKQARIRGVNVKHENIMNQTKIEHTGESLLDAVVFEHDEDTIRVVENWDTDTIEVTISDTKTGEAYDGYRLPPYVFSIIGTAYMNMMDGYTDTDDETQ